VNPLQIVISQLVKVALLAALVGIFVHRRHRDCQTFPFYLALVLVCDTLVSVWPELFYTHWFWILQQSAWDLAKLGIGLELAFRVFRSFPGARPVAQGILVAILAATTAAIIFVPSGVSYTAVLQVWQPRVLTGTIWLMTAVALLVVWYRLPIRPFQKAILIGFVPYLVIFVSLVNVLHRLGWQAREWYNVADATAYLLAVGWWAWAAWRPEPDLAAAPEVMRRLGLIEGHA
jgi:hypothetical protein